MMRRAFIVRNVPAWVVNGITVALGLALVQGAVALLAGAEAAQVAIATAVCASLADVVATADRVARRVLVAVVASTIAATLFMAVRPFEAWVIPAVALILFATMMIQSWGPKAGTVSFAAALSLVFAMSLPASQALTWDRFAWGLAGSAAYWAWAVVTARLLQPTWRNFALAATAQDLSALLGAIGRQIEHPDVMAWQSGILDAEAVLAERLQSARDLVFGNDGGPGARRETAILLHLIDLRDLAMASNLEAGLYPAQSATQRQSELTGRVVAEIGASVQAIALHLRAGTSAVAPDDNPSLQGLVAELDQSEVDAGRCDAVVGVSHLLRNKLELLASMQRLLAPGCHVDLPCQRSDLRRYIAPDEWTLVAVTSNLRTDSPILRHSVRTCVTATAAYALAGFIPWSLHPQWIVLTVITVMQGNLALTLVRRNARVLGTLAGCVIVLVLTTASSSALFLAGCFVLASGIAHAFFGIRYSVTAAAAAVMALLQAHLAVPADGFSAFERFGDTVVGAVFGWAATYALPTWERKNLPGTLKQAVEAIRAYAAEATAWGDDATSRPRLARQRAYDAIRALSALRSRSLVEPEDVRVPVPQLTTWLAAAYGLMANLSNLRLGLTLHGREHATPGFLAALASLSRELDALLGQAAAMPLAAHALSAGDEHEFAVVAHLLARVRHTLAEASRVSAQAGQIETLVRSASPETLRPR